MTKEEALRAIRLLDSTPMTNFGDDSDRAVSLTLSIREIIALQFAIGHIFADNQVLTEAAGVNCAHFDQYLPALASAFDAFQKHEAAVYKLTIPRGALQ